MNKPQTGLNVPQNTASLLNRVRSNMSADFQNATEPVVTTGEVLADGTRATVYDAQASLRAFGNAVTSNESWRNEFLDEIYNRIALVIITSKSYENPWANLKRGMLEYGDVIEDIFVDICDPKSYNPTVAESEVEKREKPDVRAMLYRINSEVFYKTTLEERTLRKAFMSFNGMYDMVMGITQSLYTSMNIDERLAMKYIICRRMIDGTMGKVIMDGSATSSDYITSVKTISNLLMTPSRNYNQAKVYNFANKEDQYVFVTAEFDAVSGVEVLAKAFNVDYVQFSGRYIVIDNFTFTDEEQARLAVIFDKDPEYRKITSDEMNALKELQVCLVDKDFFMVFDNLIEFTERLNQQGLYRNNWLHVWKTYASGYFANAVMFTKEESTVTSVTVTPATATLPKNTKLQLMATVVASTFADKSVVWSVSGTGATIDQNGLLTLDNTATGEITVTAKSVQDESKTNTATITVSA